MQVGTALTTESPPPPLQDTTPLDVADVERIYGWKAERLKSWRRRGKGPPFVRMSERVYVYRRCDIERWLLARRQVPAPPVAITGPTTLPIDGRKERP